MREIQPQQGVFGALVEVPGSKSISNRALVLAALAEGETHLSNVLFSDDTRRMLFCLKNMGIALAWDEFENTAAVLGCVGRLPLDSAAATGSVELNVGNAGTAARFLPCVAALGRASYAFDADARMLERPMEELLAVLEAQGSRVSAEMPLEESEAAAVLAREGRGYPLFIHGGGLKGGEVAVNLSSSSQFASGLLLAAPYAGSEMSVTVSGDRLQLPYVEMTAAMMSQFGVEVARQGNTWRVPRKAYQSPGLYEIEPDVSAAAYFFAAGALIGGKVTIRGLSRKSLQGDIRLFDLMKNHWDCQFWEDEPGLVMTRDPGKPLKGLDVDMNAFSDQALTIAALAPFCEGPTTIRNVAHIRRQECDRIQAMVENLGALGVKVDEREDGVTIHPGVPHGNVIQTFGDHRVAMAFSLVGLKVPGVVIDNEACVSKTFEKYWQAFDALQKAHV